MTNIDLSGSINLEEQKYKADRLQQLIDQYSEKKYLNAPK